MEMDGGLVMIYDFDAATMTATLKRWGFGIKPSPSWSWFNRDLLYAVRDARPLVFATFNSAAGKFKDVHDASVCLPQIAGNSSRDISVAQLDANSDGVEYRMLSYLGSRAQDLPPYVHIYDRRLGCRYLNTSTGAISGQWGVEGN